MKSVLRNGLFAFGAMLLAPHGALATPNFPPAIQNDLGLAEAPLCEICHDEAKGPGDNTATTPFALSMRTRGLVPYNVISLRMALDAMIRDKVDSVGDGTPDIDDLKAGRNPNMVEMVVTQPFPPDLPKYGCSLGRSADGSSSWLPLLIAFVLLLWPLRVRCGRAGRRCVAAGRETR